MSRVSVILPVYNCDKFLAVCLDSIISPTYSDIEIICIDDGSSDSSGSILDNYAAKDSRILVVHRKNSGVSEARNYAMKLMSGEYVMFVDADDWLERDAIEETLRFVIENKLDICSFSYISERDNGRSYKELFRHSVVFDKDGSRKMCRRMIGPIGEEMKNPLMLDSYGTIWAKLYKRTTIEDLQFESLNLIGSAEDSLFNMFAYSRAHRTGYVHRYFYHYRKNNEGSITKKFRANLMECWKAQYDIIRREFGDEDSLKALNNRIAINHYGLIANYMKAENRKRLIAQLYDDVIFSQARSTIQIEYMSPVWRVYFYLIKHKALWLILLYHRIFAAALKLF